MFVKPPRKILKPAVVSTRASVCYYYAYNLEGQKIKKKELRIGLGGFKHGGRCVISIPWPMYERLTNSRSWRHWKCITPAFLDNMKSMYPTSDSLPGFLDLSSRHRAQVSATYNPPDPSRRKDTQATRRSARLAQLN